MRVVRVRAGSCEGRESDTATLGDSGKNLLWCVCVRNDVHRFCKYTSSQLVDKCNMVVQIQYLPV